MVGMYQEYFSLTKDYIDKYGDRTILFYQNGGFIELFGRKNKNGEFYGSKINEFSKEALLAVKMRDNNKGIYMAGFPIDQLEKYLKKGVELDYTIPVYLQEKSDISGKKGIVRKLFKIVSKGTTFNENDSSNNIICVWISKSSLLSKKINIGISLVDVITGYTCLSQYDKDGVHDTSTYDDLERCFKIYNPNEIIFIHNLDDLEMGDIINYLMINVKYHIFRDDHDDMIKNCSSQIYQKEQIKKMYPESNENIFFELLNNYSYSLWSFCYLLYFLETHNSILTKSLKFPELENFTKNVLLANHSLTQLNILCDNREKGKKSSIIKLFNECKTSMGQRLFIHTLTRPTIDEEELLRRYTEVDEFIVKDWEKCRTILSSISDLEKIHRKVVTCSFNYCDLQLFYKSLIKCEELCKILGNTSLNFSFIKVIKKLFNLSVKDITDTNFINEGVSQLLDLDKSNLVKSTFDLHEIKNYFETILKNVSAKKSEEYIKIHNTPKNPSILTITKVRAKKLKENLPEGDIELGSFVINKDQFNFTVYSKSECSIKSDFLDEIMISISDCKLNIIEKNKAIFEEFRKELEKKYKTFLEIINYIKKIDILQCKCYLIKNYNLVKPELVKSDRSFVDFEDIRHPLIEVLNIDEIYVTNSLNLKQLLLYGTNAVGKTSLIKAIGISVILAQSGFYVPCNKFKISPFKSIFTRILGNDNIFKGLSTFAVEMVELRTILNLSDERSLVLGDELCSGTDVDSALSIFTAGIDFLYKKRSTFVFATHFHQILDYPEIDDLKELQIMHMTVNYDNSIGKLIYDRKLKEGCGEKSYGLEVCKGSKMPYDFLEKAYSVRNKNMCHKSVLGYDKSKYNSQILKGICESCHKNFSTEVHHLVHQKDASENGYINGNFHKNHPANLTSICEECHKKYHSKEGNHRKVKTLYDGYEIVENN